MKIIVSYIYGGFGFSEAARDLFLERGGIWDEDANYSGECLRTNPSMVAIVEELGQLASGCFAKLTVVDLPKGTHYRITDYDGYESIECRDAIEWQVAT